jgi:small subunit ribosomal protein S29
MSLSPCLRGFSQLYLDRSVRSLASRSRLAPPHAACFSTSVARYANPSPKKGRLVAAPKRGVKSLNVKKGRKDPQGDSGKRPGPGDRKAQRKRVILRNDNALEVTSLHDVAKGTILNGKGVGQVRGIPYEIVDALRAVEAFKPTQGWGLFHRPAMLMRKQTLQVASLLKDVEESEQGQKKTIRRVLSGERLGGKSTLLLQGLTMAFLRGWVVINLPEGILPRALHMKFWY